MDALVDLELLVRSRYPIIAVETWEEDRLGSTLRQIGSRLKLHVYEWSVGNPVRRLGPAGGDQAEGSQTPLEALRSVAQLGDGIFHFKDLYRFLTEAPVTRRLVELAPTLERDRRSIVLSAPQVTLPAEIEKRSAFFRYALPTAQDLKAIAKTTVDSLKRDHKVRVEITDQDFDQLVDRLRGMTLFEAEKAVTAAVLRDLALTKDDLAFIVDLKKELLAKDGVLEFLATEGALDSVGGFKALKSWLGKRRRAFSPEAKEFGIQAPKGILLLGVQGCLRGDTRVLLADGRMPTLESLARQVSDCLEPGVYDVAHRVALEDGTTALAAKLQIHEHRETALIRFADGRELEATPDHELLTPAGWKPAGDVKVGDEVVLWDRPVSFATPPKRTGFDRPLHSVRKRKVPVETLPDTWSPELAELVGLIVAEGCQDRYRVTLTLGSEEYELSAWLRERSEKLFGIRPTERMRLPKHAREFRFDAFDIAVNLHPLIQGTKRTKAVPDAIFALDDVCVAGFLRGLFEGDGCVVNARRAVAHRRSPRVELKTVSQRLAQSTQLLLQRLGIYATIRLETQVYGFSRYPIHRVVVRTRKSLERFASTVGFLTRRKQQPLIDCLTSYSHHTKPRFAGAARVVEVERTRFVERVYDLTVPVAERFIANGLVVHNCGKTLVAKSIAEDWGLPLLKMEPGKLYDKFIGESEKNLEKAIAVAEGMAPCVVMIDEIEKGFASVSSSESDAGLSRRIFGRLLGWLQDRKAPVFIVATSNDIEALPPEMVRKGRFDEIFFIDLPDADERKQIFQIHLAKRKRDPARFDLAALSAHSDGFSGAEIEQAVVSALYTAFSASAELATEHVVEELEATRPLSVTRAEAIANLRAWAAERAVGAR
ncbi:MAG: AAA family ATPase [Candidatus Rokubacteria bacterium]|nr:AAA family ATPase [Candidatus Rokubacteria bacterium]